MLCRATFPSVALSTAAEPPHERHGSTLPMPVPSRDVAPAATTAPLGAISSPIPEIANPTGVDTEVVSDTRHHAGSVLGYVNQILERSQLLRKECGR